MPRPLRYDLAARRGPDRQRDTGRSDAYGATMAPMAMPRLIPSKGRIALEMEPASDARVGPRSFSLRAGGGNQKTGTSRLRIFPRAALANR